jgi:hypothetical protein
LPPIQSTLNIPHGFGIVLYQNRGKSFKICGLALVPLPANGSITSPSGAVTSRTSQRIRANGLIVGCLEPLRSALLESHMGDPAFGSILPVKHALAE